MLAGSGADTEEVEEEGIATVRETNLTPRYPCSLLPFKRAPRRAHPARICPDGEEREPELAFTLCLLHTSELGSKRA